MNIPSRVQADPNVGEIHLLKALRIGPDRRILSRLRVSRLRRDRHRSFLVVFTSIA